MCVFVSLMKFFKTECEMQTSALEPCFVVVILKQDQKQTPKAIKKWNEIES